MLLRTVVNVLLQPASLGVLHRDDPLPRRAQLDRLRRDLIEPCLQLRGQPDIAKDLTRLRGEVCHELPLHRSHWFALTFLNRQLAERLTLMADLDGPVRKADG